MSTTEVMMSTDWGDDVKYGDVNRLRWWYQQRWCCQQTEGDTDIWPAVGREAAPHFAEGDHDRREESKKLIKHDSSKNDRREKKEFNEGERGKAKGGGKRRVTERKEERKKERKEEKEKWIGR